VVSRNPRLAKKYPPLAFPLPIRELKLNSDYVDTLHRCQLLRGRQQGMGHHALPIVNIEVGSLIGLLVLAADICALVKIFRAKRPGEAQSFHMARLRISFWAERARSLDVLYHHLSSSRLCGNLPCRRD
jgi:hypothetical protein